MKTKIYNLVEEIKQDFFNFFPEDIKKDLTPKSLLYRFINTVIFSWILSFYVYILFLAYMRNYKFFSYDFFGDDGFFAMNILSLITAFFLIIISLFFTGGFVIFFIKKVKNITDSNKLALYWNKYLIILNIILIISIVVFLYETSNNKNTFATASWILFLMMISIFINFHMVSIFLIGFSVPLMLFSCHKYTSQLLSISLTTFGIANNKVSIINITNQDIKLTGKLIFLSPKNIYLINEKKEPLIIERKNNIIKYVK